MFKRSISIKWYDDDKRNNNILQIYKKGLEFSFVSENNEQCHPFIFCKDFLQIVIFANIYNRIVSIFNFHYNPRKNPICLKEIRILLKNKSDKEFIDKIKNSIDFINQFEKKLQIKKTKFKICEDNTALLIASKRWLKSPPLISMYMLLIRIGMVHKINKKTDFTINGILENKIKPYQVKDCSLLKNSMYGIKKIMRIGDRKCFCRDIRKNYPDINLITIHRDGILSYSTDLFQSDNQNLQTITRWQSL